MHAPYKLDMRDKGDLGILKLKCTSKKDKNYELQPYAVYKRQI